MLEMKHIKSSFSWTKFSIKTKTFLPCHLIMTKWEQEERGEGKKEREDMDKIVLKTSTVMLEPCYKRVMLFTKDTSVLLCFAVRAHSRYPVW